MLINEFNESRNSMTSYYFACQLYQLLNPINSTNPENLEKEEILNGDSLLRKIEDYRDSLLGEYIPKFDEVLANDPKWKFIKEKTDISA